MSLFEIPTFLTLLKEILGVAKDKRSGASTAPGSDADVQSWTLAHVIHGLHLHLKYGLLHQIIPTKASGWVLSAWAWLFGLSDGSGGYGRIKARGSTVDAGFTFYAEAGPGWVDLEGEIFTDTAGQRFMINESYTPTSSGTTDALDVICLDTGQSTNLETWRDEDFTWESTPTQMRSGIAQTVDLDGGADKELDGPLRARLAEHLQSPAMGGNWPHWKRIAEEASPSNIDCWIWEGAHNSNDAYGTTDIACTQRSEDGEAKEIESTDALYDTINDAFELLVMYGALYRVRFLDSNAVEQDVELTLTLNSAATAAQRCDWDAESVKLTVSAYNASNKTITCSADCHEVISVGDRVVIYNAQAIVTKVGTDDSLAADTMFEVAVWFGTYNADLNPFQWPSGHNPTTEPDHVCSGGGLIINCIRALRVAVFRPLGPNKGSHSTAAPIPGWEHKLRVQNIQTAMITTGDAAGEAVIIDATVAVPAVDISPAGGTPDTDVYFLSPGELIIWEAK